MTESQYIEKHGARVRRSEAMALLGIRDTAAFRKVVDANPGMKHKLSGEGQTKYLTSVIYGLLLPGEGTRPSSTPPGVRRGKGVNQRDVGSK